MKLILTRTATRPDGIFGLLQTEKYGIICSTLEHAYPQEDGNFISKIPAGEYMCVLGEHRLHDLKPFDTFEVQDVPNHTGILFHIGNYNEDSEGCILLGKQVGWKNDGGRMLMDSKKAFKEFMQLLDGKCEFTLLVENAG